MSTEFDKIVNGAEIEALRKELKGKNLTREEISDIIFTKTLSRMSVEDRVRMMCACMFNDTFTRIRYRKTKY